ncbi:MAG: hypothetical protein ACPKQO_11485 [Nitrososphaeraceae archaeon]
MIRISMYPDQFVLLNDKNKDIIDKSIKELEYHADLLDVIKLYSTAKIQIHVDGVYDDKEKSIERFVSNYKNMISDKIKKRIVIENDDHPHGLDYCLKISEKTQIPILFDFFYHICFDRYSSIKEG